jgi:hypothetical protein
MVYGHLFPKATEQERESLRRLGLRWKVCEPSVPARCKVLTSARLSNTNVMAYGFTNNIRSGVLATRSGSCIAKRRISSCTCHARTLSTSKEI